MQLKEEIMKKIFGFAMLALFLLPSVGWSGQGHVGNCNQNNDCTLILHTPIPAGDNIAGVSFQNVLIYKTVGTLATILSDAEINSATEKSNIASGTVMEFVITNVNMDGVQNAGGAAAKQAAFDALTDRLIQENVSIFTDTGRWRGYQQPPQ
jgi:hypothetical protein